MPGGEPSYESTKDDQKCGNMIYYHQNVLELLTNLSCAVCEPIIRMLNGLELIEE